MVGDFMISSSLERGLGSKKIFRARPNLALGWTGRRSHAQQVLIPFLTRLSERPTRPDLETALAALAGDGADGPLKLAGWIADESEPQAFLWDATAPEIHWGEPWFIGSGGSSFELYSRFYKRPDGPREASAEKAALVGLLATLAQLNGGDVFVPAPSHAIGVGAGYEALYWSQSSGRFEYVSSIIYFAVRSYLDRGGRVAAINLVPLLLYEAEDETSFLLRVSTEDPRHFQTWAVTPPATRDRAEVVANTLEAFTGAGMSLRATYYAGLALFAHPTHVAPSMPIVACPWDREPLTQGTLADLAVRFGPDGLERQFRQRAEAHRANPLPFASFRAPVRADAWLRPREELQDSHADDLNVDE